MNWEKLTKKYLDKRTESRLAKVRNVLCSSNVLGNDQSGEMEEPEEGKEDMEPDEDFKLDEKDSYKYWKGGF